MGDNWAVRFPMVDSWAVRFPMVDSWAVRFPMVASLAMRFPMVVPYKTPRAHSRVLYILFRLFFANQTFSPTLTLITLPTHNNP